LDRFVGYEDSFASLFTAFISASVNKGEAWTHQYAAFMSASVKAKGSTDKAVTGGDGFYAWFTSVSSRSSLCENMELNLAHCETWRKGQIQHVI
jgi:hypothetical protein